MLLDRILFVVFTSGYVVAVVSGQGFDFSKVSQFLQDAGGLIQSVVNSFASFSPSDFTKIAQTFLVGGDIRVAIEILEGIVRGGDTMDALFTFAETETGALLFAKLDGVVGQSLELREKYEEAFGKFKAKAALRRARKRKKKLTRKKKKSNANKRQKTDQPNTGQQGKKTP